MIVSIRERIEYDPETGIFRWISPLKSMARWRGRIAGCLNSHGYIQIMVFGEVYQAANLAWLYMTGESPDLLDHINGNRSDNRFSNLREVTASGNARNMRVRPNKEGHTGISWDKPYSRYKVRISAGGRRIFVGHSKELSEAIELRKAAERRYGYTERHGMVGGEP